MLTDINLSTSELSKIIQSGRFSNIIDKLGKNKTLMILAVPLSKYVLPQLATMTNSLLINIFERTMWGSGVMAEIIRYKIMDADAEIIRYMDNIIRIIKALENSSILIHGVTETVKYEIKRQQQEDRLLGALLAPMAAS